MKTINFQNAESLIFMDKDVQAVLPPYMSSYFEQWKLSKRVPMLANMGRQAILDLINGLEDEHIAALEEYFGETVLVEKLNYHLAQHYKIPLADAAFVCAEICKIEGRPYYTTWRDKDYLYISTWR